MTTLFTAKHISNVSSKGIYIIHSVTTGLDYIGSTARTFTRRWRCHLSDLRLQKHPNKFLQNVYNKYGENDLTFNVLEVVDNTDQIINREKYWVEHWKPELNLAIVRDGRLGTKHSEESKLKMKLSSRFNGKNYTETEYGTFAVQLKVNGKSYCFGTFKSEKEALKRVEYLRNLQSDQAILDFHRSLNKPIKHYHFDRKTGKYRVQLRIDGKRTSFGYFKTEDEAKQKVKELIQNKLIK